MTVQPVFAAEVKAWSCISSSSRASSLCGDLTDRKGRFTFKIYVVLLLNENKQKHSFPNISL